MTDDPKFIPSRRDFIQLAAAGAVTALSARRSDASPTSKNGTSHSETAVIDPGWISLESASEDRSAHEGWQTLNLNGNWSVTALPIGVEGEAGYRILARGDGERLAAQVPGEIHLDLMRAGRMEDPSISDNARTRCRWPEEHSWWYRTEFTLPSGFREYLQQRLIFDGIDLYGQVFVNGKPAGTTKNAFATAAFDVKGLLQDGTNELVVRVTSGTELVPPADKRNDQGDLFALRTFDQRSLLRKPAYAYGWDWCDPLPNIGIWRSVRLEGRNHVLIHHVRLDTVIRGKDVSLQGEVILENIHPWSENPCVLELLLEPPQGESIGQRLALEAPVGRSAIACRIAVPNAQLWWPNGMGEQPLYRLTARVLCDGEETDRQAQTIGLRTVEVDRSPLPDGSRFCFKVNGQEVYCKGGNWAPADLIGARVDAARYQQLIAEARNAHFNMFRVNGVGLYESDEFYDACDRAGILLWQDFTFSCARYPDKDPDFMAMVRDEAEGVIRRLRHHPSLALWCGNNECGLCMVIVWKSDPSRPEEIGGVKIYNEVLPNACGFYDPARPYRASSPSGGASPGSKTSGDIHGPYGINFSEEAEKLGEDVNQRKWQEHADEYRPRFVSEYGIIGPPNMASVREYLKPNEISLESTAWKIHVNQMEAGATSAGITHHYGDAKGLPLPEFLLYGQMYQAMHQGGFVESMRFRKNDPKADCQGVLVWSYNDCWGETGWSIIDHYIRRKASYYWFRRSAAPVKVLVRSRDGHLVTRAVNDTLRTYQAAIRCGWIRLDGSAQELQKYSVTLPANGMIEVASASFPSSTERSPREWLYAATLTGEGIPEDQALWLLAPHRELALAKPMISVTAQNGMLTVSSPVYCHGVHLEDDGREVLADNYFELLPGISRHIPITKPAPAGRYALTAVLPIGYRAG